MQFINNSRMQCRLFTGALSENVNGGWVVARETYALPETEGGPLVPAPDRWPIFAEPLKTDFGVFPSDDYPFRPEAEVVVVGSARSRGAVRHLEVKLEVGPFSNRLIVFGNRRWMKRGSELVASDPEPFVEMDLGLKNSFGGVTDYEGMAFPHPLNPEGKGFHLSPEEAAGKPLPNIERPDALIRHWNDQPMIATWSPISNSQTWQVAEWLWQRTRSSKKPIDEKEVAEKGRNMHQSAASPPLLLKEIRSGDIVRIDLGAERLAFRVPEIGAAVRTQVGDRRGRQTFHAYPVGLQRMVRHVGSAHE
jgi:hypothetical protein